MKCSEAKGLFFKYIIGEIEIGLEKELEKHFETCVSCKTEFEILSSFMKNMEEEKVKVPPELDYKTVNLIETRKEESLFRLITKFLYPIIFTLGLILGVFLGMGLNKNKEDKTLTLIKENTFYIEPYIQNISPEEVLNERE